MDPSSSCHRNMKVEVDQPLPNIFDLPSEKWKYIEVEIFIIERNNEIELLRIHKNYYAISFNLNIEGKGGRKCVRCRIHFFLFLSSTFIKRTIEREMHTEREEKVKRKEGKKEGRRSTRNGEEEED